MQSKNRFCAMLDCSRNAVMKPEKVKEFAKYLAAFGYNALMLYTEDTYEVENEPYFGYMRGRYTIEEVKDIDEYCRGIGIELIPCIQTLAHLKTIFRWQPYASIRDVSDIMFAGEARSYELLENIFSTLEKCYATRTVHIGMDEARLLGAGNYFDKHGFEPRFDILKKHLEKVCEIAVKHGFKVIMWSDMFFSLANGGKYYPEGNERLHIDERVKEYIPDGVELVFWDYYHTEKNIYDRMFDAHEKLTDKTWFAGGLWTWSGFSPLSNYALEAMLPAIKSAVEHGIKNVIMTLWGDDGGECSAFSALPTLFYLKRVYDGEKNEEIIKSDFNRITGENFDDFMKLSLPNEICGEKYTVSNPCKYLLYNDPFIGLFDSTLKDGGKEEYAEFEKTLRNVKSEKFGYLFECAADICGVLSVKYDLGARLRKSYKDGDKKTFGIAAAELLIVAEKLEKFYDSFSFGWYKENKPFGFEVQDARIGGLIKRTHALYKRARDYLDGKIENLPELEEELLDFYGNGKNFERKFLAFNYWAENITPGNA